ncbi:MAG: hypothetical protein ABIX46_05240 [Burkholderiaceae bacterium]
MSRDPLPPQPDRRRTPASVPTICIDSRSGGGVVWRSCLEARPGPNAENLAVDTSHCGQALACVGAGAGGEPAGASPGQWALYIGACPSRLEGGVMARVAPAGRLESARATPTSRA